MNEDKDISKWIDKLKLAILRNDLVTTEHICSTYPNVVETIDKDGNTPLHLYLSDSYREPTLDTVTCLLQHNASVATLQNKDGNTLLHLYLCHGYKPTLDIVTCLLKRDASAATLQNKDGNTPLHLYLNRYKPTLDIATCLLKYNASAATLQNEDGDTPLHLYLSNSHRVLTLDIVTCLLQHNASAATLQNKKGYTPATALEKNTWMTNHEEKTDVLDLFDKLLVPAEIYSKGKNAISVYKDELKHGTIAVVNSRCMFLGKEGAGKTSCVKAMLGERFNSNEPSTDGIVTTTMFQARGKDHSKWKKVKDVDDVELSNKIRTHALAENVDKKLDKQRHRLKNECTLATILSGIWNCFLYTIATVISRVIMTIRGKNDVIISDRTSIWDYAGQLDYYNTHRFFLTNTVSYCVTFNVLDDLDEPANPRDPTIDSLGMTNFDMNLFWVRSIYEHTVLQHGSGNAIFIDGKRIESPPICLVATHMDKLSGTKLEKQEKAKKKFIQMFDKIEGLPYSEHVDRKMYMVDNTVRSPEGIIKLKQNVGRHMKEMLRKVPVKWVDFQERLQIIGKTELCIKFTEVSKIGTECGIYDGLTTAITYLNDTGIIMYIGTNEKLRTIVITNLHWMIRILTKVITVVTPTIEVKKTWMLWKKLNNEGVLEEKLLRYLWRNEDEDLFEVFVELMKVFRLLFEKTKGIEEGNRVFLVPCRMKVDKEENLEVSKDDRQTVSLYLTPTDFLPDAVYNTLVVAFLELMTEKGSDDSEVFRNRSDFKFSNHTVSLGSVKINHEKEKPYALKLEITRWTDIFQPTAEGGDKEIEFNFKPEPSVCLEVLSYLKKQLETTCTIYEGIGYNLRVLCTACEPSKHHLIDLDKCLTTDRVPCGRRKAMNTAHIKHFFSTEPKPESLSASLRVFGESPEKKFQTMLVQVSNWYDEHDSLDMLTVLCKDLITPYNALQKADTTMELFNLLKRAGKLTATNFKVLIDIINVTGTKGALEANKYLKNMFDESDHHVTTVTRYRQKLIDFGKILSQDNVRMLINLNDVSRKQRDNQWTVILYLEERGILREDKLLSFIEHLKENKMDVAAENLEDSN